MNATDRRLALLAALRTVAAERELVVVSEWLGYLPYGQYSWVEVDGVDVSASLPSWEPGDYDALEAAGSIIRIAHRADGTDSRTTFRIR